MKKNNKLSLSTTILIASVIIGGFYYASQVNKQNSIERQQEAKLELEQQKIIKDEAGARVNRVLLDCCMADAEKAYWDFMKLNGTEKEDGTIRAQTRFWDSAKETKSKTIDNCFKKYPQK